MCHRDHRGVYRTHSRNKARHGAAGAAGAAAPKSGRKTLVTLDHLWWRIRDHLDGYLEVADSEIRHVQQSFVDLSNYENCQTDFQGLLKSYASSMLKMTQGHRKLQSTWREAAGDSHVFFLHVFLTRHFIDLSPKRASAHDWLRFFWLVWPEVWARFR